MTEETKKRLVYMVEIVGEIAKSLRYSKPENTKRMLAILAHECHNWLDELNSI